MWDKKDFVCEKERPTPFNWHFNDIIIDYSQPQWLVIEIKNIFCESARDHLEYSHKNFKGALFGLKDKKMAKHDFANAAKEALYAVRLFCTLSMTIL